MIRKLTIILLLGLLMTLVQAGLTEDLNNLANEVEGQQIPSALSTWLGNERINVFIQPNEGEEFKASLVTENNQVVSLAAGEAENPSLLIYTSEATLARLQQSTNPLSALQAALRNGDIRYEGVGFRNRIKFAVIGMFSRITSLFGEEEERTDVYERVDEEVEEEVADEDVVDEETEEAEEVEEEVADEDVVDEETEEAEEVEEEVVEEINEEEVETSNTLTGATHVVQLINTGFEEPVLTIKKGDRVIWENVRDNSLDKAMIIGTRSCNKARSKVFFPGSRYSYTFEDPGSCIVVDGIYTTQSMKVVVE